MNINDDYQEDDNLSAIELNDACMDALKDIKDGKTIDESTVRNLTSIMRELDSLRELFYIRLFNSLKRGDMLLG